jgi:hypothetical protein
MEQSELRQGRENLEFIENLDIHKSYFERHGYHIKAAKQVLKPSDYKEITYNTLS